MNMTADHIFFAFFFIAQNLVRDVHIYIFSFCMIFEDAYERSVNSQDYDNKQRKNHKEEKATERKSKSR